MPAIGVICDRFGATPTYPDQHTAVRSGPGQPVTIEQQSTDALPVVFSGAVLGSGTLGVTYIAAVSPRFVNNRGLAYGITLAGTGLSAFPIAIGFVCSNFSLWTGATAVAGTGAGGTAAVANSLVLHSGAVVQYAVTKQKSVSVCGDGVSLAEAIRTRNFWLLAAAFLVIALFLSGLMINLIPLLTESGLSASQAASATAGIGAGLLFARVFRGLSA